MGYLFLTISVFCGTVKGFCGKKTSGFVNTYADAMKTNIIRMILCMLIGLIMIAFQNNIAMLKINSNVLFISALSGLSTSVFVVSWIVSVKKGAYMMLDVFLMLGVLVTICLSAAFFKESVKPVQWLGFALLTLSVIIMCSYNNSVKEKITFSSFVLLIIAGVSNGLTDFSQKLFVNSAPDCSKAVFNFYTYVFSVVTLFVFCIIFKLKNKNDAGADAAALKIKTIFGYVFVMSVCLFLNSYFKTLAAAHLTAAQLYPLCQGTSLALSAVMSALFFKERLTAKCVLGIVLAFFSLLIINLL